ncbi:helix-turn-helix transcriptional regulator [Sphingomicrobium aestuariivivum]|uniref:helix-turn-helix transcriptional regulator n=1 Tax=Sphingomicrobium aestuariivivum TaxID=1582356 RepID=UPI001FD6917F|nr:helix-turn-helix transcriptional regulator [Sphingomicrobium aestuariivivum]MCJ8191897.1 AAA family ATPase [Sphingomicrobium aestuariivivum]
MILGNHFVGRDDELASFAKILERLHGGAGQLVVVSGHAGIGKTALARRMSSRAAEDGVLTYWSAFPEQRDCPPYRGWIGLCRSIAADFPDSGAAALVQQMEERASGQRSHWQLVDRLTAVLREVANDRPVALFFDDILHADRASAALLEMLAAAIEDVPVLLLVTFRENDGLRSAGATVPPVAAMAHAHRFVVRGMDQLECAHFCHALSGWMPDTVIARRLHRQTEGNPLFLRQIVQSLVDEGHVADGKASLPPRLTIPEGIIEAIGMRLSATSPACRLLLERAAVLGRVFDLAILSDLEPAFDPALLDEAAALGLVRPDDPVRGRWQFTHALVREVLYDAMAPMQRLKTHAEAASTIERVRGADDPDVLAALAYHAFEGQMFVGARRVIDFAWRAGRHAVSVAAYHDAAAQFRIALECHSIPGIDDEESRIDTCLLLAEAEHLAGDNLASIEASRHALELARKLGDWSQVAAAAIAYEKARWQPGLASDEVAPCLELALDHADELDDNTVVRLQYCLGTALLKLGRLEDAYAHGIQAIEKARALGDPAELCDAIEFGVHPVFSRPGDQSERLTLVREAYEVAKALQDAPRLANAIISYGYRCACMGDWATFRILLGELRVVARELAQPHFLYVMQGWTTTLALFEGDFAAASASAVKAKSLGERISGSGAGGMFGTVMFLIQRERGTLGAFAELTERIGDAMGGRAWKPGMALMLAEAGRLDQASALLDRIHREGIATIPEDDMRRLTLAMLAETCWRTGNARLARALYEELLPDAGAVVINGPVFANFGPVDRLLGLAKASLRNVDEAHPWLESALDQARDWGSMPAMLRVACDHVEVLLADGSPQAIRRARELEEEFAGEAGPLGMASLADRFAEAGTKLRSMAASHGFDQLTPREVEVLREIAGGASNAAISRHLHISVPTVATHVRNIFSKIDCRNRTAAAGYARRIGLVANDTPDQ